MNAVTLPTAASGATVRPWTLAGLADRFWLGFATVLAVLAGNVFWGLAGTLFRDCDEARYGVAASEMLAAHAPLVTTYAGATEYWNLKPPLGYWMIELAYVAVGPTPFALRLPAALCAIATVALTMLFARRVAGNGVALLAGAILTSAVGFIYYHGARSGELDLPLTLLLTAVLALSPDMTTSRQSRMGIGLLFALAFLLKSFAILPFAAAIALYLVLTRGPSSLRSCWLPTAITFTVAMTWAASRSVAEGSGEFVRRMVVEDLLLRTTAIVDTGQHNGPLDYVGALADRLAPWLLFIVAAAWMSRRSLLANASNALGILFGCYLIVPLVLFSLARTHHSWYILPTYPAWSIVAAIAVQHIAHSTSPRDAHRLAVLVLVLLAACEVRVAMQIGRTGMPPSQTFLASLGALARHRGIVVDTTFVTTYSERFVLQVVDGFEVRDLDTRGLTPQGLTFEGDFLIARSDAPVAGDASHCARLEVVASSADYAVFRHAGACQPVPGAALGP